jgi:hypothetical protein
VLQDFNECAADYIKIQMSTGGYKGKPISTFRKQHNSYVRVGRCIRIEEKFDIILCLCAFLFQIDERNFIALKECLYFDIFITILFTNTKLLCL